MVGAGDLHFLALASISLTCGRTTLAAATALGVDHHQRGQAGHFVDLLGHRQAFFDVLELHLTGEFGDDRARQRIPVGQDRAGLDGLVGLDGQRRTVRHLVALALAAMVVLDDDFTRTRDHHQLAFGVADVAHRGVEADHAVGLGFHARRDGAREAAPPMWKVRMVSCVPGSPMDWAPAIAHGFAEVDQPAAARSRP